MTEVENTAPIVTTKKEKDPRRVEAGKRLAAISKQAKERKRRERESSYYGNYGDVVGVTWTPSESTGYKNYMITLSAVGVVVALATLWYTMYPRKRTKVEEEPTEYIEETPRRLSPTRPTESL